MRTRWNVVKRKVPDLRGRFREGWMIEFRRECGPRIKPRGYEALPSAMAAEIRVEVNRRGLRPRDIARLAGISARRAYDVTAWLSGSGAPVGVETASRIADALGLVPVVTWRRVGEEARAA